MGDHAIPMRDCGHRKFRPTCPTCEERRTEIEAALHRISAEQTAQRMKGNQR